MSSSDDLVGTHNGAAAHQGTTDSAGEHDLCGGEDQEDVDPDDEKRRVEKISWHDLRGGEDRQDEDLDDEKDGNE